MALRTPVFATPTISQQDEDAFAASGMSSLRRGYEAGRIGTDINAAAAQEASLRRAAEQGDAQALAEAEALRANIGGLQRRQAMYAPEVGKVEDINSLGTFGSWAAGQVGQGAASVQDPLAVGAALQGAGTLLSAGPGVMKGVGAGLRGAGYAVPFLMNQRQMTGEAYNAMAEDEALMARTSAAERERNANLYGAGAGALDTVVPGMIAGKLTGAGLRQGIAKSGLGARTLGGMGMEGTTEALQQFGQQQTLGYMNPDRDTSGDFMENVNAFAGGAIGAGPMVMAGEMADGGYRRVGDTAQKVSEKTGEVVDLLSEKAEPYTTAAKGKLDKVVDLFAGEDGKVTPSSIKDKVTGKAKDVYADFEARAAERDVISGMPPDTVDANDREAYGQWYTENAPKRMQTVADKLGKMVEDGDEQAAKIYEGLTSQDDETRANALEEGASHILNQDEWAQFGQEAERRAKQASRWANKFGKMAGAAGRAAGEAAVDFGKSVVSGAMKKNAQGMEGESLVGADNIYDPEAIRKRDFAIDKEAENWNEARQRSFNRAKIMSEFMAEELKVAQAMPASRMGGRNVVGGVAPEAMTGFMKDMGLEIADLAENWHATPKKPAKGNAPSGPMSTLKNPADSKGQQYNGLKLSLNRIVRSLKLAYGERAQQVINELQAIDQNSAPELFDVMREELTVQQGPRAARHNAEVEREAQSAVIDAMGQDVESRLIEQGVNVREAGGRKKLFEMVKAVDDGVAPPAAVRALEKLVGKDRLLAMRSTLRPAEASRDDLVEDNGATLDSGVTVNDDGEVEVAESNQLDKALGETKRDRMGAKRMVGFRGTQRVRLEGGDKRDVFAASGGVTGEDMLKFQDEFSRAMEEGKAPKDRPAMPAGMRRPRLAFRGDTFTGGEDAVEGSRARFERRIGAERTPDAMIKALRAEGNEKGAALAESMLKEGVNLDARSRAFFENRSEGGKWAVNSVSVKDYLDEEGADPLRRVALYRDYIQQAAYAKDVSPEEHQSMSALARRLSTVVGDMAGERAGKGGKLRTSPMDRKEAVAAADRYFAEHFVNVADQATDAIPEQISAGEIDAMAEMGKRMLDSARKGRGENAPFNFPVLSKKNLIIFEHRDKDNKGKAVYVQIPANRLAAWGNFQRTAMEGTKEQGHKADKDQTFSNTDKDMDFLLGLTVGIQAIRTSGVVKNAFPTKVNAIGGVEKFQSTGQLKGALQILDGLPPSLELATMTVAGLKFKIEKGSERYRNEILPKLEEYRAKNSMRIEAQNDAKKLGEWSNEPFVAKQDEDELPPGEVWGNLSHHVEAAGGRMSTDKSRSDTPRAQPTGGASRPKAFVEGPIDPISGKPEYRGRINVATPDVSRTFKSSATGGWDARGTTYEPGPTPSDFSAPEGFEDVRDRTKAQGRSALQRSKGQLGPETPLTASKMAETRAQTIRAALIDDGLEALAIINRRLRQAEQPRWGADKNSVVGGAQYAIPIIKALDDDTLAQFDADDELKALRDKAVEIVRGSDLSKALKAEFAPETKPAAKGVGASLGKPSGEAKLNRQAGSKASTQAERDAAVAEVIKTLGKDIDVRFEQTTGFSGAYLDKEAAIVISLTPAAGTLQTAYHEALHAFVARLVKGNDKAKRVLDSLVNHAPTMERVRALLADHPEALKQLIDGEERLAYIYQFWRAGLLDLPETQGTGLLQKLRRFFRGMLGRISDLERSSDLLGAFARGSYAGDVSVAGKVMAKTLAEGTWSARNMRKMDGLVQKVAAMTAPAQSLLLISDSKTAQKLGNTFWTNPGDEESGDMKEGYLNARERMAKRYTNEFSRIVRDLSERDHKDVITYLQKETDPADIPYQPHREAVEKIRALLQRFRVYMTDERGMKIGDRGPLYFPRVWSPHRLTEKKADFIAMMKTNHPTFDAEAVYNAVLSKFEQNTEDSEHGREDEDAVLKPTQSAGNKRILDFITGEQAQPFLEQSLVGALSRYFHEGARAAEYTARFGQTGKKLEKALSMIHAELRVAGKKRRDDGELADQDAETKWVERQMRDVNAAVDAMEGTLGRDISDGWRKTNSWVTVYQNVRLLPMALFSSIVDPLGMVARGAPMREAYDGFLRGMSEVVANWGEMITGKTKEHKVDKWERLAMAVGSVDAAVFNHHVSDEYASVFMSAGAKKINDFMFKANGMEAWNRGMRVAATKSAAMFITRHKGLPDTHSERWLKELGLNTADVYTTPDGELITNKHVLAAQEGIDVDDAAKKVEKIHYAINRWVQGAVLTPNAAQRPAWGSDPHYSMFFHLKQFSYSFHQTILKRAVKEMNHGNLAPLGAFVWYIPVMIASDITKGLIQGGGELPAHMKGMDLGDWVAHGAERAGLLGLGQVGVDANQDLASIGGPAVEQIIDAFSDPLERTMIKAAPAHGLYAEALK